MVYIFLSLFFLIFSLINYYVISRVYYALAIAPPGIKRGITAVLIFASTAYPLSKIIYDDIFPEFLYSLSVTIGAFWFAYLMYAGIFIILIDLTRLFIGKRIRKSSTSEGYAKLKFSLLIAVFFVASGIVLYGYLNAKQYQVTHQQITVKAAVKDTVTVRMVFLSDLHFSVITDPKNAERITQTVNQLDADYILLGGDIVDDTDARLVSRGYDAVLRDMQAKKGKYTVLGNHEYIVNIDEALRFLQRTGFVLLRDTAIAIDSTIYLIGRDDPTKLRETGQKRKDLFEIVNGLSSGPARIMIDHQPSALDSSIAHGIDFQLSGHTHNGQMFPGSIVTSWIYKVSYGYARFGDFQLFVSSGTGGWGPTVKIGSKPEILEVNLTVLPGEK